MPDTERAISELRELIDQLSARLNAADGRVAELDDRVADLEDHVDELDEQLLGAPAPTELDAICDDCGWTSYGFGTPTDATKALEQHKAARHPR